MHHITKTKNGIKFLVFFYKNLEVLNESLNKKHENCLRTEDIIDFIEKEGDEICLILFPGIQHFTGQFFKIKEITEAAHRKVEKSFYLFYYIFKNENLISKGLFCRV